MCFTLQEHRWRHSAIDTWVSCRLQRLAGLDSSRLAPCRGTAVGAVPSGASSTSSSQSHFNRTGSMSSLHEAATGSGASASEAPASQGEAGRPCSKCTFETAEDCVAYQLVPEAPEASASYKQDCVIFAKTLLRAFFAKGLRPNNCFTSRGKSHSMCRRLEPQSKFWAVCLPAGGHDEAGRTLGRNSSSMSSGVGMACCMSLGASKSVGRSLAGQRVFDRMRHVLTGRCCMLPPLHDAGQQALLAASADAQGEPQP